MIFRPNDNREWHLWFAWYPVWSRGRKLWFETVARRYIGGNVHPWEYERLR